MTNEEMIKQLEQSEERYRALVEMSPFCIITLQAGKFKYVNESGLNLLKAKSLKQLEDTNFSDIIQQESRKQVLDLIDNATKENQLPKLCETKILCIDGTSFEAEMTIGTIYY